jgi:hypothetical protein
MFCSVFSAKKMSKNAECTHAAVHTLQLCFLFSSSFQFFIVSRREREKKKKRKTIGRLSVFFTQKKDFGIWFCDLSCNLNNKNTIQYIQFLSFHIYRRVVIREFWKLPCHEILIRKQYIYVICTIINLTKQRHQKC